MVEINTKGMVYIYAIVVLALISGFLIGSANTKTLLPTLNENISISNESVIPTSNGSISISMSGKDFFDVNNTNLLIVISNRETGDDDRPLMIYAQEIDGNVVIVIPFFEKGPEFLKQIIVNETIGTADIP